MWISGTMAFCQHVVNALSEEQSNALLDGANIKDMKERNTLLPQLMRLRLPIPEDYQSDFLTTYADRLQDAKESCERYRRELEEYDAEGWDNDNERGEFVERVEKLCEAAMRVAGTYKNDLENYARALLEDWKKGFIGSLV